MQRSEFWPELTAHSIFWPELTAHSINWMRHNNPYVYEYDPTDDGPEVEVIVAIRINHPELGVL